jgi:quercetin 2,3-dioxygenase
VSIRPVKRLAKSKPTLEGAGVHLHRAFGFGKTSDFDPFLLLDDFRNDIPDDYLAGFPWHPHRGIETITYVLAGEVEHGDSMGNKGSIGAGDVQWMTAGSGIIHQEMPKGDSAGRMHGFQLWANLPAALKMTTPRYQEVKSADIPIITTMMEHKHESSAELFGVRRDRWTGLPQTHCTWTSRCRREKGRRCQ